MTGEETEPLTVLDEMVLRTLTESTTSIGVVRLAADMWREDNALGRRGDPVGLVALLVTDLAERGLVSYREHTVYAGQETVAYASEGAPETRSASVYENLPHTIRLTSKGWALMGFAQVHLEAGSHLARTAFTEERGDRTSYRTHRERAEGGPIERDTFEQHYAAYPAHVHMYPWIDEEEDEMALNEHRRWTRVTPEIEAAVIASKTRHPEWTNSDISENTEIPERTVKYVLTELPRLRAMKDLSTVEVPEGSLRQRILWVVEQLDIRNVADLRRVLGRADQAHDIVHVLHNLKADGKITFVEDRGRDHPVNIRITRVGKEHVAKNPPSHPGDNGKEPEPQSEVVVEAPPEPTPAQPSYPLLQAIIEREQQRRQVDGKQTAYLQAAEALRGIDDEAAASLIEKASKNDVPFPSPIEAEYLAFARDHSLHGSSLDS